MEAVLNAFSLQLSFKGGIHGAAFQRDQAPRSKSCALKRRYALASRLQDHVEKDRIVGRGEYTKDPQLKSGKMPETSRRGKENDASAWERRRGVGMGILLLASDILNLTSTARE